MPSRVIHRNRHGSYFGYVTGNREASLHSKGPARLIVCEEVLMEVSARIDGNSAWRQNVPGCVVKNERHLARAVGVVKTIHSYD
jgi:hypothetical protein